MARGNPNAGGARTRIEPKIEYDSEIVLGLIQLKVVDGGISFGNEKLSSVSVHKTKPAISI